MIHTRTLFAKSHDWMPTTSFLQHRSFSSSSHFEAISGLCFVCGPRCFALCLRVSTQIPSPQGAAPAAKGNFASCVGLIGNIFHFQPVVQPFLTRFECCSVGFFLKKTGNNKSSSSTLSVCFDSRRAATVRSGSPRPLCHCSSFFHSGKIKLYF